MKIDSLYIDNYKLLNDFKISFKNGDLYNPITVITGINGSGKTTLLRFIHEALSGKIFPDFIGNSYISIYDKKSPLNEIRKKETGSPLWIINKESYIKEQSIYQPPTEISDLNFYQNFNRRENEEVLFYESCKDSKLAELFIKNYVDKLIYEEDIVSSEAYSKMREVINMIFQDLNLQIEFDRMDKDKIVYFRTKMDKERSKYFRKGQSNNIRLNDLSGGERTILTKILPLYLHDFKNGIILIDEPEISLHPNWQFQIIDLYKKIAKRNNNQIIIATHSPQIVASVKQENVKILIKEDGKIRVVDSSSNTYGKRLDEVLLEVFQVNGLRTPLVENKIDQLKQMLSENKYETNEFVSLLNELKEVLNNSDSDLLLINLELARKKKMNEKNN